MINTSTQTEDIDMTLTSIEPQALKEGSDKTNRKRKQSD